MSQPLSRRWLGLRIAFRSDNPAVVSARQAWQAAPGVTSLDRLLVCAELAHGEEITGRADESAERLRYAEMMRQIVDYMAEQLRNEVDRMMLTGVWTDLNRPPTGSVDDGTTGHAD